MKKLTNEEASTGKRLTTFPNPKTGYTSLFLTNNKTYLVPTDMYGDKVKFANKEAELYKKGESDYLDYVIENS